MKKEHKHIRHLPKNQAAETLGWVGAVAILSSYAMLSFGLISSSSTLYHGLLFLGSSGLAIITFRHRAFQSFIVNTTFSVLAIIAIIRIVYFA